MVGGEFVSVEKSQASANGKSRPDISEEVGKLY